MKRLAPFFFATAAAAVLVACGGGGGDKTFFKVDDADDAAHAAMFGVSDMPGSGWEVTQRDDESESDFDFVAAAKKEPACSSFNDLSALSEAGGIFGSNDNDKPAGRAQIEMTRAAASDTLPTTAELEVKIVKTGSEVNDSWKTVKGFLESDGFGNCMANVVTTMFKSEPDLAGITMKMVPAKASVTPPQDGASMAFALTMSVPGITTIEAQMEMYLWPYGNAKNTVQIMGEKKNVTKSLVEGVLNAADNKIVQAEKDY